MNELLALPPKVALEKISELHDSIFSVKLTSDALKSRTVSWAVNLFDEALGRPPFKNPSPTSLKYAGKIVAHVLSLCCDADAGFILPSSPLKMVKELVTTLPILACAFVKGSQDGPDLDFLCIVCAALLPASRILEYPITDFLAAVSTLLPTKLIALQLLGAMSAISDDVVRTFLKIIPTSTGRSKPKGGKKINHSEPPVSAAIPPAPEIVTFLAEATLSPFQTSLLLQKLDNSSKFSEIVGSNSTCAEAVLKKFGNTLARQLKPAALLQCVSPLTSGFLAELFAAHPPSVTGDFPIAVNSDMPTEAREMILVRVNSETSLLLEKFHEANQLVKSNKKKVKKPPAGANADVALTDGFIRTAMGWLLVIHGVISSSVTVTFGETSFWNALALTTVVARCQEVSACALRQRAYASASHIFQKLSNTFPKLDASKLENLCSMLTSSALQEAESDCRVAAFACVRDFTHVLSRQHDVDSSVSNVFYSTIKVPLESVTRPLAIIVSEILWMCANKHTSVPTPLLCACLKLSCIDALNLQIANEEESYDALGIGVSHALSISEHDFIDASLSLLVKASMTFPNILCRHLHWEELANSVAAFSAHYSGSSEKLQTIVSNLQCFESKRAVEKDAEGRKKSEEAAQNFAKYVAEEDAKISARIREQKAAQEQQTQQILKRKSLLEKISSRIAARERKAFEEAKRVEQAFQARAKAREEASRTAIQSSKRGVEVTILRQRAQQAAMGANVEFLLALHLSSTEAREVGYKFFTKPNISKQQILEFIVTGKAEEPYDLRPTAELSDSDNNASWFSDGGFWDDVAQTVVAPEAPAVTNPKEHTFHWKIAPVLDTFDFINPSEEQSHEQEHSSSLPLSVFTRMYLDGEAKDWGFDDVPHAVFVASQKRLVHIRKGLVHLTPLGYGYHVEYRNPQRSFSCYAARLKLTLQSFLPVAEDKRGWSADAESHSSTETDEEEDAPVEVESKTFFAEPDLFYLLCS